MPRKILLFSASLLCLPPMQGSVLAAESSQIISKPLTAPQQSAQPYHLAQVQGTKNSASAPGKKLTHAGESKAKTSPPKTKKTGSMLDEMSAKAKDSLNKGKAAVKNKAAKIEEKAAKTEKKAAKTAKTAAAEETKVKPKPHGGKSAAKGQQTGQAPAMNGKRTQRQRDFMQAAGQQNCVCTSGKYCVGPRGGHYCYSSGGNKRYLKRNRAGGRLSSALKQRLAAFSLSAAERCFCCPLLPMPSARRRRVCRCGKDRQVKSAS